MRQRNDKKDYYLSLIFVVFLILIPWTVIFSSPSRAESESPKTTITGSNQGDYFGWNVSSAGDVNGDGYDDAIVGAPYFDGGVELSDWWNANWSYRKNLTFDNSGQSVNLTNFPVLINLSATNFDYAKVNLNASDLRFIDDDGATELKYHIEEWNPSGYSHVWVNVTDIDANSDADFIWLYYGNPVASYAQDVSGTYDANYRGIWHLNETGTGTRFDATQYANDGTPGSYEGDEATTGKIGGADEFNDAGPGDYIDCGADAIPDTTYHTITAWVNLDLSSGNNNYQLVCGEATNSPYGGIGLYVQRTDGAIGKWLDSGYYYSTVNTVTTGEWAYIAIRGYKDFTSGYMEISMNGGPWENIFSGNTNNLTIPAGTSLVHGKWPGGGPSCDTNGILDEIRISNIARSQDWITAQYLSMNNSFITYGSEETMLKLDCGAAYIFLGGQWFTGNFSAGNANVTIIGEAQGDRLGWDVSGAGDVNNDTFDDVIIGTPGRNNDTGAAYIFYGNVSMPLFINPTDANVTIGGGALGDEFGSSVSDAGYINGDDYDDVIIGAPKNGSNTGTAYVFYGNQSDGIVIDAGNANVTLSGQLIDDRFGFSVSGAGDANNDSCDDMIVGAPGADKAYIFFGNASLSGVIDAGNANVTISSLSGDNFGWSVADAGDVDNDGYDDVIVGAPMNNSATGAAYIFYGIYITTENAGDKLIDLTIGDSASVTLTGEYTDEMFGYSVSGAGNVNGDGYDDVIVGAPMFTTDLDIVSGDMSNNVIFHSNTNGNGSTWGQTTVYTGAQNIYSTAIGDIDGDDDLDIVSGDLNNNVIFHDNTNGDGSIWGQTTVYTAFQNINAVVIGDIDGDGDADIVSGDQTGNVIFHNNTNGDGSAWTQTTVYTTLNAMWSVAIGDMNGDGFLDIVSGDANNNVIFHNNTNGDGSVWTQTTVFTAIADINTVAIGDIDGDKDLDIVSGGKNGNVTFHDNVNGDGGAWVQAAVYTATIDVYSVALGDIDRDKDLDIVSGDSNFNVTFHDNVNGDGSAWNKTNVYTAISDIQSVAIGDMEGDGFLDIVSGDNNNDVIFHDNINGDGSAWNQTTVYSGPQDIYSVALGNIDGDEIQIGRVYIYYGSATPDNVPDIMLTGKVPGGSFGWAVSGAGDMNKDGLDEIIVGAPYYDEGSDLDTGKAYLFQHGTPILSKPILKEPGIAPILGFVDTWFNFSVNYSHPFDKAPDIFTLNLTGPSGGIFGLMEVDPSDMDYTDGKLYYYNMSGLAIGSYSFHFAANDTDGNWTKTSEIFRPSVVNSIPWLSASQVNPAFGYIDSGFNFSVIYTDLDNHAPNNITVNITGLSIYGLFEDDPSDTDYSDGKTFYVNLTGIPLGTVYTFHFAANDTIGDWVEGPEMDGPDVINRAPTLSDEGVDPTAGYTDTWFNFTVTYTDLEGHAPDIITVNITGLDVYDLFEANPLDMDYSDGKIYYINITDIPLGTSYTFHFAANDTIGDWAIVTPEIDAPDVQQRTATLTSFDKTVEYSDNIILNATLIENGTPVAGADVAFYIDINDNGINEAGEFVGTNQTLADGMVSLNYTALIIPGSYSYISSYQETVYAVTNSTAIIFVDPKPAAITAYDHLIEEGQGVTLNATLEDEDENGISLQNIEFYVDRNRDSSFTASELVGSGMTDNNGYVEVVDVTLTPTLSYGSYGIWAKYKGSGNYSVTDGYASLTIQNSTNNPPLIVTPVPDQIKPEDSPPWTLDLTPYESDLEDSGIDLLWYLTGVDTSLYTVTGMNSTDDVFTFIPVEDAFGNDEVTLWLVDSSGGTCFQKLWVNITPVNDRPKIEAIDSLTVHYDAEYTYIFTNYVSDIESPKEDLVLTTDDLDHTTVDGLSITFLYPETMLDDIVPVLVTVTDPDGGSSSTLVVVKVSEDWVPELEIELPDVTLYEGETVENIFDLDDYFSDPDGDALFYATGQSKVTIYIDPDTHIVDMTAPLDWYGIENVTFNALDPNLARVEDLMLITVLPVNDVPSISDVPDLVVRFEQDYKFDLSPYIRDEDDAKNELVLTFNDPITGSPIPGINVDPDNNLGMIINLPESMNGTTIQLLIWINDGLDSNFTIINITVSDNYPPELIVPFRDVSFEEDTELINAFNVLFHFIDIDDPLLVYSSGNVMVNVIINPNGSIDFSAPANWSGSENVIFRATDDSGALMESVLTVTVIPVNDAPTISQISDQIGEEGKIWVLDIHQYLSDVDNDLDELILSVDNDYVIVAGHSLIFDYPEGIESDVVTITVSDGELENSVLVDVTIEPAIVIAPENVPWLWILLLGVLLAFLLGFFLTRIALYKVDDLLLITKSGVLITFASSKTDDEWEETRDKDVIAAMFVAVQEFVKDAFARKEGEALKRMDYGDKKVLIAPGNHVIMAAFISGHESKVFTRKMKIFIDDVEERYSDSFSTFSGYLEDFSELGLMLVSFLEGHYKKGPWKKHQTDLISEKETKT